MSHYTRIQIAMTGLVLLAVVMQPAASAQKKSPFTTDLALNAKSFSIADVTDDGHWIAYTVRRRIDRLNVDHQRFGDPTYISPSLSEVWIADSRTGARRQLFDERVQVRSLTWDDDGERLALFVLRDGEYRLFLHEASPSSMREIDLQSDLPIAGNSPIRWSPDGSSILLTLRPEGWAEEARTAFLELTEGPVIVQDSRNDFLAWDRVRNIGQRAIPTLVSLADGSARQLLPETIMQSPNFASDGSFLTYVRSTPQKTGYARNEGTEYELYRLDLPGGDPVSVMEASTRRPSLSWNRAGDAFAYSEKGNVIRRSVDADSSMNITEEFRIPVSEDDSTRLSFSFVRWSENDDAMLLSSQKGYHLLDQASGDMELVYTFEEDEDKRPGLNVIDWSEDGRYVYMSYSARDKWERGMIRYDLDRREATYLVRDASLYRSWHVSNDGSTVVFSMSDGDRPNELFVADADFENVRQLTDLNPWVEEVALTRSELVSYLDVDGNELYGILYYPIGYEEGETYPLVAEIYETFFNNGFNENMNLIAGQGWFGFRPSVRLEEGFPGEAWLKGVTAGINSLIDRGIVDKDKLGVHGTSYGGYATNLLITQTDRFAAAVNISGKVNIISFLGDSPKITTRNYRAAESGQDRIGATLWEQPQKYIAHTAIMFADRIETPLLMLSGEGDWNVPATNQREMYYALRRLGKEVVWVHYSNAGHGAGRAGTESDFHDHWQRMFDWYSDHFESDEEDS